MGRKAICKICGMAIEADDAVVPYKGGKVHGRCFNSMMQMAGGHNANKEKKAIAQQKAERKERASKPSPEPSRGPVSEEEYQDKKMYLETVERLTRAPIDIKNRKISEDYINKYGFTYRGMRLALEYEYDIKGTLVSDNLLWKIPYVYEEANRYFEELKRIQNYNSAVADQQMYEVKVVRINPKKRDRHEKLIDMESLTPKGS